MRKPCLYLVWPVLRRSGAVFLLRLLTWEYNQERCHTLWSADRTVGWKFLIVNGREQCEGGREAAARVSSPVSSLPKISKTIRWVLLKSIADRSACEGEQTVKISKSKVKRLLLNLRLRQRKFRNGKSQERQLKIQRQDRIWSHACVALQKWRDELRGTRKAVEQLISRCLVC